jgi:cysteine-rich repeat protein
MSPARKRFLSVVRCWPALSVAATLGVLSCEGKQRPSPDESGATNASPEGTTVGPTSGQVGGVASNPNVADSPSGSSETIGVSQLQPADGGALGNEARVCAEGSTESCGPPQQEGMCKFGTHTCTGGAWGPCIGAVLPASRDCSSAQDNDCDGQPDNNVDDVCRCPVNGTQACDAHLGLDGKGSCHAGQQLCVLGQGNASSDWGACSGSVGPSASDSCTVPGDDATCDGTPNGGCSCVEGTTVPCGPPNDNGICQRGTSVCKNGAFTACQGAVFPSDRDCSSADDNDCDGVPDNTLDAVCTCVVGATQACGAHPGLDGNGACHAGQQVCQAGAQGTTSRFGACNGAAGPAQKDSCTKSGDDSDCNGTPNSGCQCIAGQGNAPCAGDPNNSRCNAQGACAPCQSNADCSLVSGGRNLCTAGVCSAPRCGDGIVQPELGEECDDGGTLAGDGCTPDCRVAHAPVGASAFGGSHVCMLQPSGDIFCWGLNSNGQLGSGRTDSGMQGATHVSLPEDATQVAVGPANTCAVHGQGHLACWGLFFTPAPTDISGLTQVSQVAIGSNQVCALRSTGTVSCAPSSGAFVDMGLTTVTQISAGNGQVCARLSNGNLRCWGSINAGQLGTGAFSNPAASPQVSIPTGVAEVSAGGECTCVRLNDGSTQCFGTGPLGNRTAPTTTASPQTVVNLPNPIRMASASNNRCALLSDQSVRCWGAPPLGDANGLPITIPLPRRAVEVGAGSDVACAVLDDLSTYCWGSFLSIFGLTPDPSGAQVPVQLAIPRL